MNWFINTEVTRNMENKFKEVVNLPTCMPMFTTYNYKGAAGIAATPNKSFENWLYNNSVTLSCNRKFLEGYTTPEVDVPHADVVETDKFEQLLCNVRFIRENIHDKIKEMIRESYYIYFTDFDDYYIKGKSNYRKRHMLHDGLICGYDDKEETYKIAAYNEEWVFNIFDTPQKGIEDAMCSQVDGKEIYGQLNALKVDDKEIKLDIRRIKDWLTPYLASNLRNTPVCPGDNAVGIVVHDFIGMYLDKILDGTIPYERIDRRVFRMLWEHKECMMKRIRKVEDKYGLNHDLSDKYKVIVSESNKMRVMYTKYYIKRNDQLLEIIKDKLRFIKRKEKTLLNNFMEIIDFLMENRKEV